jgi:hypothetical protein
MINPKSLNNLKPKTKTKQAIKLSLLPTTIKFLRGITGKANVSNQVDYLMNQVIRGALLSERKIEGIKESIVFLEKREDPSLNEIIVILKKILPKE